MRGSLELSHCPTCHLLCAKSFRMACLRTAHRSPQLYLTPAAVLRGSTSHRFRCPLCPLILCRQCPLLALTEPDTNRAGRKLTPHPPHRRPLLAQSKKKSSESSTRRLTAT